VPETQVWGGYPGGSPSDPTRESTSATARFEVVRVLPQIPY